MTCGMPSVSVVVIGRNEEAHIGDCLRAVLAATAELSAAEVVYVDSASTDRTVDIARSTGVRVVALRPEWKLSPSAGRYAGFHHTTGDLVMFVDGDTVIESDWLRRAIPYFDEPKVGGLTGVLDDVDEQGRALPYVGRRCPAVSAVGQLRGSGLYRRAALEQAGPFNPYLDTEEEAELGLRLRQAGGELWQVPHQMGCHRRGMRRHAEIWRDLRLGRCQSLGRTWRYACRAGLGWRFCRERLLPSLLFASMSLLLGAALLLWLARDARTGFLLWLLPVWLAAVVIRKRSLRGPLDYVATHVLIVYGLVVGAIGARLKDPQAYPRNVVEISPAARDVEPVL